jgi:hypothetical protein
LHQGEAELRVGDIQWTEQEAAALGSGTLDEESRSQLSGTESEDEVDLRHLRRPTVATAIHTDNPVESRNGLTSHPLQDPVPYKEESLSGLTSHALPPRSIPEALARSDAAQWKEAIRGQLTRRLCHVSTIRFGKNAHCRRASMHYHVSLSLQGSVMADTKHA